MTGTYTGIAGTDNIAGTAKGPDVEWSFENEQAGKISHEGKLDASGKIVGTVEYGQIGAETSPRRSRSSPAPNASWPARS